jgi:putative membrane protein
MSAIATAQLLLADMDWDHMDGGAWFLMGLGMIIFWGLVILGVVWLVRTLTDHNRHQPAESGRVSALELLDRKLAEGEISVDEYRERREILSRSGEGG